MQIDEPVLKKRPTAELHKGSKSLTSGAMSIDEMIDQSGCSKVYAMLEECLGENNRDWKKCQVEVKDLKTCSNTQTKAKK